MPTFAAIDIGSNSVRLKIARLTRHRLHTIDEDREVTRLGEHVFRTGLLSPEVMSDTIKVLRRFHRAVQKAGADSVRIVATSALRDARKSALRRLRAFVEREVGRIAGRSFWTRPKAVIATSGTAASLAAVCHGLYKTKGAREATVSRTQMKRIAKMLVRLPIDQRRKLSGVGPRRAEIIAAGAVVYAELLERCQLGGFRYSPLGLRDGLLAQMAAEYDRGTRSGKQIESERWDSIRAAVNHYHVDIDHALQVRDSAMRLFIALNSVHRLPPEYREWLSAAAMLYEVGDYVNRSGRHRHAHYVISHSEILGYTPHQRWIIAAIARYLGKSRPNPGDAPMKTLLPAEQEYVRKASLLLRLARALNLGRGGAVRGTRVRVRQGEITLGLLAKPRSTIDLELWAVEKERSYFREVFGRELSAAAA